jgi:diguanylate cyclase (GGDEF)-like protein
MMDISEAKRTEASLRWAAQHDPLTDLPNRALFREQLAAAISDAASHAGQVGLIILDVDQFKQFNDTRGHSAGDKLLCWIAQRLEHTRREGMMVARLGGDEFAIILRHFHQPDSEAVLRALQVPFSIDGEAIDITVSAGIAIWPHDANRVDDLLKCADLALYACKAERQNGIRLFHPEMRAAADKRAAMLELAASALRDDRISAYYQPKVCLKTGTLIGMEALLRWQHLTEGLQSPAMIAAAFDNVELAVKITDRILDCVLADVRQWLDQGLAFGRIAVNASAADFMRGDFAKRLLGKLDQARVSPQHLELEVTENVLVGRDASRVGTMLRALNRAGVTIALDDFGTGYASLSHLNAFPVDVLKIDQSFVRTLSAGHRASDEAVVRAIIGLAQNMRILTVAEGVETLEQSTRLQELRCDAAQGYLFNRPVAASAVPQALTQGLVQWPSYIRQQPYNKKAAG